MGWNIGHIAEVARAVVLTVQGSGKATNEAKRCMYPAEKTRMLNH
jgi:hypothetical protein